MKTWVEIISYSTNESCPTPSTPSYQKFYHIISYKKRHNQCQLSHRLRPSLFESLKPEKALKMAHSPFRYLPPKNLTV